MAAMVHGLAMIQTGPGKHVTAFVAPIGRRAAHFILPGAFLYQRHIPQSDRWFGLSETAPGQKTLVFFGLCR